MSEDGDSDGKEHPVAGDEAAIARAKALVGTVISDRYRLHNLLAMGGMGAVFTAEHVHMRKRVAVKLLHSDMQGLPGLVARFEREAIVGAHVEHTNVAAARDFGKLSDGSYYLVLEFVRGLTLRQLIYQGPISPRRAAHITKQIAAGLAAVHSRGIVHRDVAPRNVMVLPGQDDHVKLIDFGFAKVPVEKFAAMSVQQGTPILPSEITNPGVIFGTIGYLAPEAVVGMKAVGAQSDLYALGAILYELLAGVPPFEAPTQAGLFLMHRTEPVPRIRERTPSSDVPKVLESIAIRLLAKKPAQRFGSAAEVIAALDEAMLALDPESRSVPPDRAAPLPLTVMGAEPAPELPRFEDVAEVTFDEPEPEPEAASDEVESRSAQTGTSASASRGKRSVLPYVGVAVVLCGVGVLGARRFGLLDAGATSPVATSPAQSAVATDASVAASPTSRPTASVEATTALPPPTVSAVAGLDAEAWARLVRLAPTTNNYDKALDGLLALVQLDPTALDALDVRLVAIDTAVRFGADEGRGAKLLEALGSRFGSSGIDALYEIMTRRGGSRAAQIATELLSKPDVRARGSKGFVVAMDLRSTPCFEKPKLMERVVSEGDERALAMLVAARSPECDASNGECCLAGNPAVELAVRDLMKKSETQGP